MPCLEFAEPFLFDGREFGAIHTEFDDHAPAGNPGMITRVTRILVMDEDADQIPEGAVLKRARTGISYEVKNPRCAGIGLTELDLHRVDGSRFERTF